MNEQVEVPEDAIGPICKKHSAAIEAAELAAHAEATGGTGKSPAILELIDAIGYEEADMVRAAYARGLRDGRMPGRRPSLQTARDMIQRTDWRDVALVAGIAVLMFLTLAYCQHGGPNTAGAGPFGR